MQHWRPLPKYDYAVLILTTITYLATKSSPAKTGPTGLLATPLALEVLK